MNDDLAALSARIDRTNELLQRMLAEVAKTPSTHAIFVDAGYLYAAAGRLVAGTEDRRAFDLDAEGLIEALIDKARTIFADSRLLRVYWYDGARRRIHTAEQQSIAELPDVKVRLGNLNANNQQKGVDSLIRSDLESLARHRAISDAALLGGDEDLVSAVEAAQGYGARVHLWGIEAPEGRNQAEPLLWEVDSQRTFDLDFFKPYVSRRAAAAYEADGHPAHPRGRPFRGRADRREVAGGAGHGRRWWNCCPGIRICRARSTRTCWWRRRGCSSTHCAARRTCGGRCGTGSGSTCRRSTDRLPAVLSRRQGRRRPRSRRGRGPSAGAGRCWGSARRPGRPCGGRASRTAMSSRSGTGQVSSCEPDRTWNGQRYGGEFGHPVRLGAQLAARGEELGRACCPASGGAGGPVVAPMPARRRSPASSGGLHGLDRVPHLGHRHHGERVPQQLHALLLGVGDLRRARGHRG